MTLDQFCSDLAGRKLSNAQLAAAILMWHHNRNPAIEMSDAELATILRDHALANPKLAVLRKGIKNLRVTLPGKNEGFRLRADSVGRVAEWAGFHGQHISVTPSASPLPSATGTPTPRTRAHTKPASPRAKGRRKPYLFIGSSVEGLRVGGEIHSELEYICEPTLWDKGVFGANHAPMHDLLKRAEETDFAVIVFTADDIANRRGKITPVARDNCIFELGLFMGALGPDRCFFVHERDVGLGLPSDLKGLVTLTYPKRSDGNIRAALQTACGDIRKAIEKHGIRAAK